MSRPSTGVILNRLAGASAAQWRQLITRAKAAGLDPLAVGDHISFHTGAGGLLAAANVLAVSERLSANTAVYLLPLRRPAGPPQQLADFLIPHLAGTRNRYGWIDLSTHVFVGRAASFPAWPRGS